MEEIKKLSEIRQKKHRIQPEVGILPVRENNRIVIEIEGKRIKKVLNLDEETIKVLKDGRLVRKILCVKKSCGMWLKF